jgi:hypothetical protein
MERPHMTETDWLASTKPLSMLDFVKQRASDRDLRLFAVACCREVWPLLTDERSRIAIAVAERFATGQATEQELRDAGKEAKMAFNDLITGDKEEKYDTDEHFQQQSDATQAASDVALKASIFAHNVLMLISWMEIKQSELLREIIPNPFRR